MNTKVVIIGAFHEIIELAEENKMKIIGLIDNNKSGSYRNYNILGSDNDVIKFMKAIKDCLLIISPDKPAVRKKIFDLYQNLGFSFTSLISNSAKISKSASIGNGTIIQFGVNISSDVNIGEFVKLNTYCNIMHNSIIGDFSTIAPNAIVLGNIKIGRNSYIGANATILPNIKINNNAVVGAGAVVTKDVPPFSIVAGNPAKILKQFTKEEEMANYFRSKQQIN